MADHTSFTRWIKDLRCERDLTQEALAERVGCSVDTISAFESGRRRPSHAMVTRLAAVLAVPPDEIAEFSRLARLALKRSLQSEQDPQNKPTSSSATSPSTPAPTSNLPYVSLPMIGRASEQLAIHAQLTGPVCRLLTLVGSGGVGKTRLAIQVATDLAPHFSHGVAFVALTEITTVDNVPAAIADALNISLSGGQAVDELLVNALRERTLLLVLDNLEHLLDTTLLLTRILRDAPGVRLLVTSRERLHIHDEWVFDLAGLAIPSDDTRAAIDHCDAVLLFLQHARRASSTFALTSANRGAIAQICRLLDGMPLGIELAAGWVRVLSCDEILAEMTKGLDFLHLSDRDATPQHRSLRTVFDRSWRLLSPDERQLLARLAIFRGGCTLEAARTVAGATLPLLAALVDKSLIRRTVDAQNQSRYDLHELVRQYAWERLAEEGGVAATRAAHAAFFLLFAETAEPEMWGQQQAEWLQKLEDDHGNLRLAMAWALEPERDDATVAARLSWAMWMFWWYRGHHREGLRTAETVLQRDLPPNLRARVFMTAGSLALAHGDYDRCNDYSAASLAISEPAGDYRMIGNAEAGLGISAIGKGDHATGSRHLEASLRAFRAIHDDYGISQVTSFMGMGALERREVVRAAQLFREGLAAARRRGDRTGAYVALYNLALLAFAEGDMTGATAMFTEGVILSKQLGDRASLAYSLEGLAAIAGTQGDIIRSAQLFGASEALLGSMGMPVYTYYEPHRKLFEQTKASVRSGLGEVAFTEAWSAGRVLSFEQAAHYARSVVQTGNAQ